MAKVMEAANKQATESVLPGLAACLLISLVAIGLGGLVPVVGAPVFAILTGIIAGNLLPLPSSIKPGSSFCSKKVLQTAIIVLEPESGTRRVFEDALETAGVEPSQLNVLMQLGSTQAIKALVGQNLGISVLSQWTVKEEIAQGALRRLNVPAIDLHRTFSFLFQKGARVSLVTKRFVHLCRLRIR